MGALGDDAADEDDESPTSASGARRAAPRALPHLWVEVPHSMPCAQCEREHLLRVRLRVREILRLAQNLSAPVRYQITLHAAHRRDARESFLDGRLRGGTAEEGR